MADIHLKAGNGRKEIVMPPLPPPAKCLGYMEKRDDDKEDIIKKRIQVSSPRAEMLSVCIERQVYHAEAKPVEDFYRDMGVLLDFEITGGIPETLPVLLQVLHKHFPTVASDETKIAA